MKIKLHKNDLPDGLDLGPIAAIDSETLGLNPIRDRLCLVQFDFHAVPCRPQMVPRRGLEPPRLAALVPETSASTNSAIWADAEGRDVYDRRPGTSTGETSFQLFPR